MNIGEKIHELRKKSGLSQQALSEIMRSKYGMRTERAMISRWEMGHQIPNVEAVLCLSKIFNVSMNYISGSHSVAAPDGTVPMISCDGSEDVIGAYVAAPQGCSADFCVKINDDGMSSEGILRGDTVFAKSAADPENGCLVIVKTLSGISVKKLYISKQYTIIMSDGDSSSPTVISDDGDVSVLGRAVALQRNII